MSWQSTPFTLPLLISGGISLYIAFIAWQRRHAKGAPGFMTLMLANAVWSLAYAFLWASVNVEAKLFWFNIALLGVVAGPPALFAFALRYTNREHWVTLRLILTLAIEPVITLFIMWTNAWHGWAYADVHLQQAGAFNILQLDFGPPLTLHTLYALVLVLASLGMLFQTALTAPRLYRAQSGLIAVSLTAPLIGSFIYVARIPPFTDLDPTPFFFTLTGLVCAYALFRHRLLDVMPIARSAVFENMSDGVIVVDLADRIIDLNPVAQRTINVPAESLIGLNLADVASAIRPLVEQLRGINNLVTELKFDDPIPRYFDVRISPLKDQRGQLAGRLLAFRDITDRKQIENALRESEIRFRSLLETAPDAIVISNEQGQIIIVNQQATKLFGYTHEELVGQTIDLLMPERFRAKHHLRRLAYVEHPVTRPMGVSLNIICLRHDGSEFPAEIGLSPVPTAEGLLVTSVVRDLTERKQVEQMREELAHMMVHDLRNPLANIRTVLEMIIDQDLKQLEPDEQEVVLRTARFSTDGMLTLINAILDVHRLENGEMPLERTPTTLFALVHQTIQTQLPMAKQKNIQLTTEVSPELPSVLIDPALIERVLQNLIGNALKFTPANGTVQVSAHNGDQDFLTVCVSDTGPGIAPEVQQRLFQKFSTGKVKGHGSGMGLAFCKLVVEAHGGKIWVESEEDQGARFQLTLPVAN